MCVCDVQLEAKCFSQQEQLDSLQEQLETEREAAETRRAGLEKELALRVDQVRGFLCKQSPKIPTSEKESLSIYRYILVCFQVGWCQELRPS